MKLFRIQTAHLTFLPMDLLLLLRLLKSQGLFICLFTHSFTQRMCIAKHYSLSLSFFFLTGTVLSRAVNKAGSPPAPLASLGFVPFVPCPYPEGALCPRKKFFFFGFSLFARLIICIKGLSALRIPGHVWLSTASVFFINSSQAPGSLTGLGYHLSAKCPTYREGWEVTVSAFPTFTGRGGRIPLTLRPDTLLPGETVFDISNSEMIPCHGENLKYKSRVLFNSFMWYFTCLLHFFHICKIGSIRRLSGVTTPLKWKES